MYIFILLNLLSSIILIGYNFIHPGHAHSFVYNAINGLLFLSFGLVFAVVGYLILKRLYIFHYDYYYENNKTIKLSIIGLSLPLIMRGLYDLTVTDDSQIN